MIPLHQIIRVYLFLDCWRRCSPNKRVHTGLKATGLMSCAMESIYGNITKKEMENLLKYKSIFLASLPRKCMTSWYQNMIRMLLMELRGILPLRKLRVSICHIMKYKQPSARSGHSACIYKGLMYVFGGRNNE